MCGLVGMAGDLAHSDENIMKRLLVFDFFRGPHSTGLASIPKRPKDVEPSIIKKAVNPVDLFDMKEFEKVNTGHRSSALIGHNRFATAGAINSVNAHPFQFGDIIGVHNGTLAKGDWEMLDKMSGEDTDVDSAALFAAINKCGIEEVIPKLTKGDTSRTGAWAIIWHDAKDNTLNFLRNAHRPLWYSMNEKLDTMIWASEYPMINAANETAPTSQKLYTTKKGNCFFAFEEDTLYTVDLGELVKGFETVPDFRIQKLEGKKEPAAKKYTPSGTLMNGWGGSTTTSTTGSTTFGKASQGSNNVIHLFSKDDNPLEDFIDETAFWSLTSGICQCCDAQVSIDDEGYALYTEEGVLICPDCTGESAKPLPTTRIYADPDDFEKFSEAYHEQNKEFLA